LGDRRRPRCRGVRVPREGAGDPPRGRRGRLGRDRVLPAERPRGGRGHSARRAAPRRRSVVPGLDGGGGRGARGGAEGRLPAARGRGPGRPAARRVPVRIEGGAGGPPALAREPGRRARAARRRCPAAPPRVRAGRRPRSGMMERLVIIPTYNERENIDELLTRLLALPFGLDVLIVDDHSPDGTAEAVRQWMGREGRVHLIERPGKLGLGSAYRDGFRYALANGAQYVFEMDADFSHDPDSIGEFLKHAEEADLVLGSRYLHGVTVVNWPLKRLVLSYAANLYTRVVTGMPVNDATGGFKCFRRRALEAIRLDRVRSDGYAFQIEMSFKCWKRGFRIKEIPIVFVDRRAGVSKMNRRIIWEAAWMVWRLRFLDLFGRLEWRMNHRWAILIPALTGLAAASGAPPAAASGAWKTFTRALTYYDLLAEGDTVWCATGESGLLRYQRRDSSFVAINREPNGLASNSLTTLLRDHAGRLWVGTLGAGASRLSADGAKWDVVNRFDGLPSDSVTAFAARGDTLLIGTTRGIALWNGSEVTGALPDGFNPSPFTNGSDWITGIVIHDDYAWVS